MMNPLERLALLSPLDALALIFFFLAWFATGWIIEHPPKRRASVTHLMQEYRREWMHQMLTRQPRIFDAAILTTLRQGTTFFASGCLIAISGVLALAGNTEQVSALAQEVTAEVHPALVWQIKLLTIAVPLAHGFLKFVWSNRLFGYCAVVMAAAPNTPDDPIAVRRSKQAAELNIRAAVNFNRGLRAIYFALSMLAWLLGAYALIIATVLCIYIVLEREFTSNSRDIICNE